MSKRIPTAGLAAFLVAFVVSGVAFVLFNSAFGGPGGSLSKPYELTTRVADSQQLVVKSLVMVRGVQIGEVTKVDARTDGARVTFSIDERYRPLRRGASVRIGARTAFGEAYLRIDRGPAGASPLRGGSVLPARATVDPDEALQVFGPGTRRHLQSWLAETGRALRAPDAPDRLRGVVDGSTRTLGELRRTLDELRGQERPIAELVRSSATVVDALGERQRSLGRVVRAADVTLGALGTRTSALTAGVTELRRITVTGQRTLDAVPGLLRDAGPVVEDSVAAARALRPALERLPATARDLAGLARRVPGLTTASLPALREADPGIRALTPVARWLDPTLRNLVPLAQWLGPRAIGYTSVLALISSAAASGDREGKWLRLFMFPEPVGTVGLPEVGICGGGTVQPRNCSNAYPLPGDSTANRRYVAGSFPRLLPYPRP